MDRSSESAVPLLGEGGGGVSPSSSSSSRRDAVFFILRLTVVYLGTVLAAGPLSGFPTLQPLLAEAGLFKGAPGGQMDTLSSLYNMAMGVSVGVFVFVGYVYDWLGARETAVLGAALTALAQGGLALCLYQPESWGWLAWVAFPSADLGGFLNSFATFGLIWHYPAWQATVMGIGSSSYQVSAALALLIAVLVKQVHFHVGTTFLFAAGASALSAVVCFVSVPSKTEVFDRADAALGMPTPRKPVNLFKALRDSWDVGRQHSWLNFSFAMQSFACYVMVMFWFGYYYNYAVAMFGKKVGTEMADSVTLAYLISGILLTPALGTVVDKVGVRRFVFMQSGSFFVFAGTCLFTTVPLQLVSVVAGIIYQCSWMAFMSKWAAVFAPPDLLGSAFGALFSLAGVIQLVANLLLPPLVTRLVGAKSTDPVTPFTVQLAIYGGAAAITTVFQVVVVAVNKFPDTPPVPRSRSTTTSIQ